MTLSLQFYSEVHTQKKKKNIYPNKNLYTNVYGSIIHNNNNNKIETT